MKTLSIIAYIGNSYGTEALIESLEKQNVFIEKGHGEEACEAPKIQCIIVDAEGKSDTFKQLKKKKSEYIDIEYFDCENYNIAQCYNYALKHVKGDYAAFVDADSVYSPRVLKSLMEIVADCEIPVEEKQCICIRPVYIHPDGNKKKYLVCPDGNGGHDIYENVASTNLCLYSYFVKTSILQGMTFDEEFPAEARTLFCIELLEKSLKYYYKNGVTICYIHALEDSNGLFAEQHSAMWYTETMRRCYFPFLKKRIESGKLMHATEAAFLYLIYIRFSYNMGASNNEILSDQEIIEFKEAALEVVGLLSFETLLLQYKVKNKKFEFWLLWNFIEAKIQLGKLDHRFSCANGELFLKIKDKNGINKLYTLYDFGECKATVYRIDYNKIDLVIDFGIPIIPKAIMEEVDLKIIVAGGTVEKTQVYNERKCFGKTVGNPTIYRAIIPINANKDFQQFRLQIMAGEEAFQLICNFAERPAARLTASCSENYWHFGGNRILQYQLVNRRFIVEKCTQTELLAVEQNYCRAIKLDRSLSTKERVELIRLRRAYWKEKNSFTKPIWITYDKLYKGGDNGEYLFHYVREHCPDIDVYYLITENSTDYERLKADNHVLVHGSLEAKLKVLHAQLILATHTNTMSGCGFNTKGEKRYLKNMYNAQIVCIQHGLTVQDIAIWQNILCDNIKLYCCASKNEVKNILQPVYGYTENEIRLTGLARYDGLINNDKRQILITPTWRRNLVNAGSSGNVRAKNDFFKHTEYFHVYNKLINDKRLIECAKKNHYKITYLIHPTLSSQINDFDKNDYVNIIAAAGDMSYEQMLTESSLMITDYSGVQFDFAYMRKPVLYYHPASLPPHYTESIAFKYDTMGFGPIIDNHDELVAQICEYMENNCVMDLFYRKRADDFFAFSDTNNCERIVDAVKEYTNRMTENPSQRMEFCDKYDLLQENLEKDKRRNFLISKIKHMTGKYKK